LQASSKLIQDLHTQIANLVSANIGSVKKMLGDFSKHHHWWKDLFVQLGSLRSLNFSVQQGQLEHQNAKMEDSQKTLQIEAGAFQKKYEEAKV